MHAHIARLAVHNEVCGFGVEAAYVAQVRRLRVFQPSEQGWRGGLRQSERASTY